MCVCVCVCVCVSQADFADATATSPDTVDNAESPTGNRFCVYCMYGGDVINGGICH